MDGKLTEVIRKRYDRAARLYDLIEVGMERLRFAAWRRLQWSKVTGSKILEVGVGTGKNVSYSPRGSDVTPIDFSLQMLRHARRRTANLRTKVHLIQMDVQMLDFRGKTFDTVVASFVFCSVPDRILGLREVERVLNPGGTVVLLEHVLSANRVVAWLMNLLNPVVVRLQGANINRRTVENVAKSGLIIRRAANLGIVKLIEATKEGAS